MPTLLATKLTLLASLNHVYEGCPYAMGLQSSDKTLNVFANFNIGIGGRGLEIRFGLRSIPPVYVYNPTLKYYSAIFSDPGTAYLESL